MVNGMDWNKVIILLFGYFFKMEWKKIGVILFSQILSEGKEGCLIDRNGMHSVMFHPISSYFI